MEHLLHNTLKSEKEHRPPKLSRNHDRSSYAFLLDFSHQPVVCTRFSHAPCPWSCLGSIPGLRSTALVELSAVRGLKLVPATAASSIDAYLAPPAAAAAAPRGGSLLEARRARDTGAAVWTRRRARAFGSDQNDVKERYNSV